MQQAVERQPFALLQQRVAVGRRLGHLGGADHPAGTGDVFHHHRLLPQLAKLVRQYACELVCAAAGRYGHDDAHGLAREVAGVIGRCVGVHACAGGEGEQGE
ncbi:hypothetical protein SDC9_185288 [bioreactor metagenome]|uniref:Uncharacterized protein n=1 Tax=bioreactor metagenome TaxID=1076179 RepID=A0A645HFF2_9ZZZZ